MVPISCVAEISHAELVIFSSEMVFVLERHLEKWNEVSSTCVLPKLLSVWEHCPDSWKTAHTLKVHLVLMGSMCLMGVL